MGCTSAWVVQYFHTDCDDITNILINLLSSILKYKADSSQSMLKAKAASHETPYGDDKFRFSVGLLQYLHKNLPHL